MTVAALAPTPTAVPRFGFRRVLDISRIHAVSWVLLTAIPAGILAVTFAINYVIITLVDSGQVQGTGAILALYGFVVAFYAQAMTQTFPFAVGLTVTRRQFFQATVLVAAAQSLGFATLFQVLAVVEEATGGWGIQLRMFAVLEWVTDSAVLQFATFFASLFLTTAVAMAVSAVFQRWRTIGLSVTGIATVGLLGLAAIVVTWARWWPALGSWFADTPRVVVLVALPLIVALAALAATWRVVRRAPV